MSLETKDYLDALLDNTVLSDHVTKEQLQDHLSQFSVTHALNTFLNAFHTVGIPEQLGLEEMCGYINHNTKKFHSLDYYKDSEIAAALYVCGAINYGGTQALGDRIGEYVGVFRKYGGDGYELSPPDGRHAREAEAIEEEYGGTVVWDENYLEEFYYEYALKPLASERLDSFMAQNAEFASLYMQCQTALTDAGCPEKKVQELLENTAWEAAWNALPEEMTDAKKAEILESYGTLYEYAAKTLDVEAAEGYLLMTTEKALNEQYTEKPFVHHKLEKPFKLDVEDNIGLVVNGMAYSKDTLDEVLKKPSKQAERE